MVIKSSAYLKKGESPGEKLSLLDKVDEPSWALRVLIGCLVMFAVVVLIL